LVVLLPSLVQEQPFLPSFDFYLALQSQLEPLLFEVGYL
jgi:hypothetical protein